MPTIDKQSPGANSGTGSVNNLVGFLTSLDGFSTSPVSFTIAATGYVKKANAIFADGNQDVGFYFDPSNGQVYFLKRVSGSSYADMYQAYYWYSNANNVDWLRCHTDAATETDRLITMTNGPSVGTCGAGEYIICISITKDLDGNTLYGIGNRKIQYLYCPESGIEMDISKLGFYTSTSITIPSNLSNKAFLSKAVNICHPELIEMKNCYTAVWRPGLTQATSGYKKAAQRFSISDGVFGFIGDETQLYQTGLFDPVLKI